MNILNLYFLKQKGETRVHAAEEPKKKTTQIKTLR